MSGDAVATRILDEPGIDKAADVIRVDGVHFRWPGQEGFALGIRGFHVAAAERLLLIGPSGGGKSTLLSLLCGIITPDEGEIRVLGTDFGTLDAAARDRARAEHFGIIFQMFNLLPYLSVMDNVLLPLSFSKQRRLRAAEGASSVNAEARRLLGRLGLDADEFASRSAARLSVGQQQRVAAVRALIGRPEILVADEPTSALDRKHQRHFLELLFSEATAAGTTVVMVSHDETLAPEFDRIVDLDEIQVTQVPAAPR
ncbi:MAG: ATP-binding cassette domain-containing protein [Geminicoccaceae bacterium]